MIDLLLHAGEAYSPRGHYRADIAIDKGRVVCIAKDLMDMPAKQKINCQGKCILPGCIDSHVHLWEDGFSAKPDFSDGSRAAAAGGITTIIDHPLSPPEVTDVQTFNMKKALAESSSYVDFALHAWINQNNISSLPDLWKMGCTAFKIFLCDQGAAIQALSDGELLDAFTEVEKIKGTLMFHAENEAMLKHNRKRMQRENRVDNLAFAECFSPETEIEAVHRTIHLLGNKHVKAVFLHCSLPEVIDMVRHAHTDGKEIWAECCPQNLNLQHEHLIEHGAWVTYTPPVRNITSVEKLWGKIDSVSIIASDHCAVSKDSKKAGAENIWEGLPGIPGTETMLPLMLTSVQQGRLTLERLTDLLAEKPAKIYGLFPRKGVIRVGSDADFTIVDMHSSGRIEAGKMFTSCGWTPYEGWQTRGEITHTIVRGEKVYEMGKILQEPGYGIFQPRSSSLN